MQHSLLSPAEQHELLDYVQWLATKRTSGLAYRPTLMRYLRLEITIAHFQKIKGLARPTEKACMEFGTNEQTLSRWRDKYQSVWLSLSKNFDN